MKTPWLSVIGIGADGLVGLGGIARARLAAAELIVGGRRHLEMLPADPDRHMPWAKPLRATIGEIERRRGKPVVVLGTGNPMWFGIGNTLLDYFPIDEMVVIPASSAFSLAAARLGWSLDRARCLSAHGRPVARLSCFFAPDAQLIVLASTGQTAAELAALLTAKGFGDSTITVLCHMDGAEETVVSAAAADWPKRALPNLNTIAVECRAGTEAALYPRLPGLPDAAFEHDGQLTKREVRAVTLAALAPMPGQLLWDVGAGAGSVAIEWLRALDHGRAVAIESQASRLAMIERNALGLGTPALEIIAGSAPAALPTGEAPDAVFLGGGLSLLGLLETCWQRLAPGGRLVANAVTFEGEQRLIACAGEFGGELVRLEISHAREIGDFTGWQPAKPVTQLRALKR